MGLNCLNKSICANTKIFTVPSEDQDQSEHLQSLVRGPLVALPYPWIQSSLYYIFQPKYLWPVVVSIVVMKHLARFHCGTTWYPQCLKVVQLFGIYAWLKQSPRNGGKHHNRQF